MKPTGQPGLHVDAGSAPARKMSPGEIKETGRARDTYARTLFGGALLVLLTICYGLALWQKQEAAQQGLLAAIGSGIGFLLGARHQNHS